jgi:hypothetical protein
MKIRKTDKEILERFLPGKDLKLYSKDIANNYRLYKSEDCRFGMGTGSGEKCIKPLVDLFMGIMGVKKYEFDLVITNYNDQVVVLSSYDSPFRIELDRK